MTKLSPKILIVDDNSRNLLALERTLAGTNCAVISALSGNEALAATLTHDFALALLDVQMPGMNGYELATILRADPRTEHLPIVFLTAMLLDETHVFQGYEAGAVDYILKPYNPNILLSKINVFLQLDRQRTELTRQREELKALHAKSTDFSDALLRAMPDTIFHLQRDGTYLNFVAGKHVQSQVAPSEFLGKSIRDVLPPKVADSMMNAIENTLSTDIVSTLKYTLDTDDGSRQYEGRVLACSDAEVVAIVRDITEQTSMEEQMRAAQRMEAVGRLAGGVAHDFNNILTVILSCSELLRSEFDEGEPALEDVYAIHSAAERATKLTNQLLTFSRRQAQTLSIVDLSETVSEINSMLRRLIGEDVALVTTLEKHPGLVEADSSQIGQVLMNLAVNARDAMPNGGKLTIETANVTLDATYGDRREAELSAGDYVMLTVSDTGTGMDEETQLHAFEPFFSTKGSEGTGLGLSTVYGIVKQNKGYIRIESERGRGTTFKVYLPRVEADDPTDWLKPEPVGDLRGSETVLLVEDDQMLRRVASRILLRNGYKVVEATHGDDALTVCEQYEGEIHVMLTDVVMPGMRGSELANRVAVLRPAMKVIYMSGYTDDAIANRGDLPEDISFIQKPFSPDALLQKLRHVFDAAQSQTD